MSNLATFTVQLQLTLESTISSFRIYTFEDNENGHTILTRSPRFKKTYILKTTDTVIVDLRRMGHRLYHD